MIPVLLPVKRKTPLHSQIDANDLDHIIRIRKKIPVAALPCPIIKGRIHPTTTVFFFADGTIAQVIHVKPIYYETLEETWRPISEIATHFGHKKIVLRNDWYNFAHPRFLMWWMKRMEIIGGKIAVTNPASVPVLATTSTFYPDPNPESTSFDGFTFPTETPLCETWSARRSNNTGTQQDDVDTTLAALINTSGCSDPNWSNISRIATLFDTSSIPDTDTISSATWSGYVTTVNDNFNAKVVVIKTSPASNTGMTSGDYFRNSSVLGDGTKVATAVDLTGLSTGAYSDSALDATGIAAISKTGVSKFGFVIEADADNSEPTWAAALARAIISSADATGTTQDPKLVVVHAAGDLSINISDAVSVAEAITMLLQSFINASDAVSIAESVSVSNANLGGISVSDAVSVSETVTLEFILFISLSDSVSVSESITVSNPDLGGISVSDAVTITESVTVSNANLGGISVSDAITVSESISLELVILLSVSDAIAVSESVSLSTALGNISVSDSIAVAESKTMLITAISFGLAYMRDITPMQMDETTPMQMDDTSIN